MAGEKKKKKKTLLTQFMRVEAAHLVVPVFFFLETRHSDANRTPDFFAFFATWEAMINNVHI